MALRPCPILGLGLIQLLSYFNKNRLGSAQKVENIGRRIGPCIYCYNLLQSAI